MDTEHYTAAIHEAGHAVMYWLWGIEDRICHVDMNIGHITVRGNMSSLDSIALQKTEGNLTAARLLAIENIMFLTAGPAAEDGKLSSDDFIANFRHFYCRIRENIGDTTDMGRATKFAHSFYGSEGDRWFQFMMVVARWSHEAITDARVWPTVEALAEVLVASEITPGSTVLKTISGSCPAIVRHGIRLLQLAPKWKRRLRSPH